MKASLEIVKIPPSSSFSAFHYERSNFDLPFHYHPEFELTFIEKSRGLRYVGTSIEQYEEGDLVLLGPNLPHFWKNHENSNIPVSSLVVQWKKNVINNSWEYSKEFEDIRKLLKKSERGIKFGQGIAEKTYNQQKKIIDLLPFKRLLLFIEILNDLAKSEDYKLLCDQNFDFSFDTIDGDRINKVQKFVEENYQKKIMLQDVASYVNMSTAYFSKYFSKTMQQPFFNFLNNYRIEKACQLLIETEIQVSEVCYDCGFDSLPHFHRQFKKKKSHSPLQYRNLYCP